MNTTLNELSDARPTEPECTWAATEGIRGAIPKAGARRTLVICPSGLCNFLMATPALVRLSNAVGPDNLELIAPKRPIRDVALATGLFAKVHVWDPDRDAIRAGIDLQIALRAQKFDFSLSLFPTANWRYCVLSMAVHAKHRIGFMYGSNWLSRRAHTISAHANPMAHDTDQNCDFVEALIDYRDATEHRRLLFPFAPRHANSHILLAQPYFVCHPGSSVERGMKKKRLPASSFATLINQINDTFGLKCALIGGPEEADLRAGVARQCAGSILYTGSRTFEELSAIVRSAAFYVGNDSGLMHVSTALGKSCIAIFGPTDDRRTGPYFDRRNNDVSPHLVVRRDDLSCSPCWTFHTVGKNPPCSYRDTRCLQKMDVLGFWPRIRAHIERILAE